MNEFHPKHSDRRSVRAIPDHPPAVGGSVLERRVGQFLSGGITADIWLTTPGVQLTLWNGLFLAAQLGGVRRQPWIAESVAWVVAASVLSVLVVLPWQERVVERAEAGDRDGARRALIGWSVSGTLLMLPFALVGWMMVSKTTIFW
jgi:hypothetical protein